MRLINGLTNAEYLKHLRAKAAAEGKCSTCRARPAKEGCKLCQHCIDLKKQARDRAAATQTVCVRCCSRRRAVGAKQCRPCLKQGKAKGLRRWARLKEQGKCFRCLKAARPGMTTCVPCGVEAARRANEYGRYFYRVWTSIGCCGVCGKKAVDGLTLCRLHREKCREHSARYHAKQKAKAA